MFEVKSTHVCAIGIQDSKSYLPNLRINANSWQKWSRTLKKLILVAERNPRSAEFFRSADEITTERKKQVQDKSWVIHPFSTFRLFYEMWMAVVFFVCLVYMPLDTAYDPVWKLHDVFDVIVDIVCLTDMVVTFRTGFYSVKTETIQMKPFGIAKNYVLSIYFICDLLSSIPEIIINDKKAKKIVSSFGLLKIVRSRTFLTYTSRTLYFFKVQGQLIQIFKILIVMFLITHYFACVGYILPTVVKEEFLLASGNSTIKESFWTAYIFHWYQGCSYLLGVDIRLPPKVHWQAYVTMIISYCIGKLVTTFATVVIIDMMKFKNSLENKYFAMMSQVDAYMVAKKIPTVIQKRMREYYQYKYRQKYFRESSITNFLSENLKKEINYHVCQKLIENVKIFEKLSRKILQDIITHLKVEIYLTGDVIIQAGSVGDCMYFIASGTVKVSSPSGKEICHLEDGAYFGEIALVTTGQKRTANIVAIEICELYKLDRKAFRKCMEENKDLYKMIQQEAKKRLVATRQVESRFMQDLTHNV